jgi:hypothetical protein
MNARPFSYSMGWLVLVASLLFCDLGRFWLGPPLQAPYSSPYPSGDEGKEDDALPLSQGNTFEEEVKHYPDSIDFCFAAAKGVFTLPRIGHWIADENASPLACRSVLVPPPDAC